MTIQILTTSSHVHLADTTRYMQTACGKRLRAPRPGSALTPLRARIDTADSRDTVNCRRCQRSSAYHRADPARIELETSHAEAMLSLQQIRSYLTWTSLSDRAAVIKMMPGAQYVIDLDARLAAEALARRKAESAELLATMDETPQRSWSADSVTAAAQQWVRIASGGNIANGMSYSYGSLRTAMSDLAATQRDYRVW